MAGPVETRRSIDRYGGPGHGHAQDPGEQGDPGPASAVVFEAGGEQEPGREEQQEHAQEMAEEDGHVRWQPGQAGERAQQQRKQ